MDNTVDTAGVSQVGGEQSALQNTGASTVNLKLVLLWLAVALPLLWGAMKAVEDVGQLFP